MAVTYVGVGTRSNSSGATSLAPSLPTRSNGDLLIAIVGSKNNATHSVSGTGWTKLTQSNSGASWTVSIHWCIVNGSEGTPTISWSGSVASFAQIMQYRGTSPTPFGANNVNTGTTSTHSCTAITTTKNNSLVVAWDGAAANTAIATPSGWTENLDGGSATGATRNSADSKTVATSGTSSGNISVTGANAAWVMWQYELQEATVTTAAYRSSDTAVSSSANSLVVNKPAGTVDDDLMLAYAYINDSTATITPPSGWSLVQTINTTITAVMEVYKKIASSEGSTYTWGFSATSRVGVAIHSFSGVDTSNPIDASGVQGNAAGTNVIAPTITTATANTLIVFIGGEDTSSSLTFTPPTGMIERYDPGGIASTTIADVAQASAAATGSKTATPSSTADENAGFLIAINQEVVSLDVFPSGIATAEALGTPSASLNVSPSGIATAGAIGSPSASLNVSPSGIASAGAVGSPSISLNVSPTGIASTQAIGSPSVSINASPTGISSAEALGSPSASAVVSPTGIVSAESIGSPSASANTSPTGIASAEATGTPSASLTISPTGISSAEAVGSPSVSLNVSPTGIASAEAVGTPIVGNDLIIYVEGIASAEALGSPAASLSVSVTGIASAEAVGTPTISMIVSTEGIASAEALGSPAASLSVSVTGIASAEAVGQPVISSDTDYFVQMIGIPSAEAVGTPTVRDTTPHIEIASSVNLSVEYAVPASVDVLSILSSSASLISVDANVNDHVSLISASTEVVSPPHIEIASSVNLSVGYAVPAFVEALSIFSSSANTASVGADVLDHVSVLSASTEVVSLFCEAINDN